MTATTTTNMTTTTINSHNLTITKTLKPKTNWMQETYTFTCHFPESGAYTVHQTGQVLSGYSKGLTVALHQRLDSPAPHCFEFWSDNQVQYAEGGLWHEVQGRVTRITGYDGVFELPKEVIAMLGALGYDTQEVEC